MKNIILIPLSVLTLMSINSCSKLKGADGALGPAGPKLTGNLYGFVNTYDEYNTKLLNDLSGVTISLDGTTKTTTTDVNGKYSFDSLTTGTYGLTISKTGFGSMKVQSLQFVGGGDLQVPARGISLIPDFFLSNISLTDSSSISSIIIKGTISSSDTKVRQCILFIGNSSSTNNVPANYLNAYTANVKLNGANPNGTNINWVIPYSDFYASGIASGGTAYFATYGLSTTSGSSNYIDDITGRNLYTAISTTGAFGSIVIP